jgi:hypothetical protein
LCTKNEFLKIDFVIKKMTSRVVYLDDKDFMPNDYLHLKRDYADSNGISLLFLYDEDEDEDDDVKCEKYHTKMYLFSQEYTIDTSDVYCLGYSHTLMNLDQTLQLNQSKKVPLYFGDVLMFKNNKFHSLLGNFLNSNEKSKAQCATETFMLNYE